LAAASADDFKSGGATMGQGQAEEIAQAVVFVLRCRQLPSLDNLLVIDGDLAANLTKLIVHQY